jgi:hemolysin activation/secretion protein
MAYPPAAIRASDRTLAATAAQSAASRVAARSCGERRTGRSLAIRSARVLTSGSFLFAALVQAFAQSPPGQFEREFQREPEPRKPPPPVVPAGADAVAPAGADRVRFVLRAVRVDGATVYPESELRSAYASLLDKEISLAQLNDLAAALTRKYRNDGYVLSQVLVPAQDIREGAVRLQAVEGYVASVRIHGALLAPRADLEAYTEKIQRSRPLRAADLERCLLLLNDLGGVSGRATLARSIEPDASDLTLDVSQRGFGVSAGVNNRGSRSLGPWRADVSADVYALTGAFDRANVRVIQTFPDDELTFASGYYERPIGTEGLKAILTGSGVDSKPGLEQNLNLPTTSRSWTATLGYPITRSRISNLSVRGTFSYYDGETDFNDVALSRDRIRALRAGVSYDAIDAWRGVNLVDLELSQGLKGLGASEFGDPLASRPGGRPDFTKVALYTARLQSLAPRWSVLGAVNAQYAFNKLLTPEEFAFGGELFGRAYDAAELLGDNGVALKAELRYSGVAAPLEYMPYVFYELGAVYRREPGPGEKARESAADAGMGLRLSAERALAGYVEVAVPLTKAVTQEGGKKARVFGGVQLSF